MKRLGNEHQLPSLDRRRGGAPFPRFGVTERCEDARLETLPVRLVNPECRKLWKHFDRHHSCLAKTLVKACVGAAFLGHIAVRNFHLGFELGAQRCIDKRGHVFRSYHDAYPPAGSSHARHLGKHAPGITLFHHSASDARVEGVVGKGQILSASLTKFYGFRQTFFARKYASLVQEIAIDIQSRDRIRCFGALSQKARKHACAAADFEDGLPGPQFQLRQEAFQHLSLTCGPTTRLQLANAAQLRPAEDDRAVALAEPRLEWLPL